MNPRKVRRTEDYHFYSLMELFEYFSNFLSREETDSAVRESAHGFVLRQFETEEGTRLQFVKRCEFAMDLLAQLKEVGVYPGFKKSNRERGGVAVHLNDLFQRFGDRNMFKWKNHPLGWGDNAAK